MVMIMMYINLTRAHYNIRWFSPTGKNNMEAGFRVKLAAVMVVICTVYRYKCNHYCYWLIHL